MQQCEKENHVLLLKNGMFLFDRLQYDSGSWHIPILSIASIGVKL
jgi:hypothetical protein